MSVWQTFQLVRLALREKAVLRMSTAEIAAIQRRRLQRLVAHARQHSPFYAKRLAHIDPPRFKLAELPILTKTEMMTEFDRFLTDRRLRRDDLERFMSDPQRLGQWYLGRYSLSHTSGTQGLQAIIVQDRSMTELLYALQMTRGTAFATDFWGIIGRLLKKARLAVVTIGRGFYPSASAIAYAPPAAKSFVQQLWISEIDPLSNVVDRLNQFQPQVLLSYANVLELLAREALAGRLKLFRDRPLVQVINMSEPLSEGAKRLAYQAFGLPVTNNYAAGECMALTTGCLQGRGMHLQADWCILEVVDQNNQPVAAGTSGVKVLMTNLYNTIQPFIRYEMADVVTISPDPCPCGVPFPLITHVEGRSDDVVWIKTPQGYRRIHPYVFVDCLDEYPPVGWYRIVQVERNRFVLSAVAAPGRQVSADELRSVVRRGLKHYGLDQFIQLEVEIVDHVAPDCKTGKLRRIMSAVGPPVSVEDSQ